MIVRVKMKTGAGSVEYECEADTTSQCVSGIEEARERLGRNAEAEVVAGGPTQMLAYTSRESLADHVADWLREKNAPPKIVNVIAALNDMRMLRSEKVGGCDV